MKTEIYQSFGLALGSVVIYSISKIISQTIKITIEPIIIILVFIISLIVLLLIKQDNKKKENGMT